tara:strand:+ start:152 stop:778 length:627 start_codon:yes stop_codon:yes gene_type:complete
MANSGIFNVDDIEYLKSLEQWSGDNKSLELIETVEISSSTASYDFLDIKQFDYSAHLILMNNFTPVTSSHRFAVRVFNNGTIQTANYRTATTIMYDSGSYSDSRSTSQNALRLGTNPSNTAGNTANGYMWIFNAGNGQKQTSAFNYSAGIYYSGGHLFSEFGSADTSSEDLVDGFRVLIYGASGNIAKVNVSLYGLKDFPNYIGRNIS